MMASCDHDNLPALMPRDENRYLYKYKGRYQPAAP